MAQAKSPYDGDDPLLPRAASAEAGQAIRREGRLRRAISRMVRAYEPPETEQGFPVHQPVHRHSQNPDGHPSGTGGEGAADPYSGSAADGRRPSAPASAPHPYTNGRTGAHDGTEQVGTWRGDGPDGSAPRSPQPPVTTTDTMTDTPFSSENAEPNDHRGQPAPGYTAAPAQGAPPPAQPHYGGPPPPPPPQGWGEEPRPMAPPHPYPGQYPAPYGYASQPPAPHQPPYDPYYYARQSAAHGQPPPPPQGHGHPPQGYGPPQQGEQPPPPPQPYPPHPMAVQQPPYPVHYQQPGPFHPNQPVMYPGPFGQPVQHIIVFTPGQQPQVITADAVASTLVPERTETDRATDGSSGRALTTADPAEDETDGEPGGREAGTGDPAPGTAAGAPDRSATRAASGVEKEPEAAVPRFGSDPELLNEALAGLAMRDLSLVDALLEMIEELETDAQDPDLLDKLFLIDNYATRMRRNGENFLVLTGHDGGESDAHDEIVPLLDVARAASSEIKDYPRVRLGTLPQTSVTGLAADDISHLLAELLDNATANSPEHAPVTISAQEMDDGRLMIVVEDEGVGIPENQLSDLNDRLSGEPVLDDEVLRHMGLYVASRIAHKHGLETRLESRSYRGVSAYTIIPKDLLRVATPRTMSAERAPSTSSSVAPVVPMKPTGPVPQQPADEAEQPESSTSAVTSAGLPRRSATPHGSPLRMMPHPGHTPEAPPAAREDTPPKLTGEARAEQIRDELGDFLDGERAARDGEELEGGGE
ncbi:hypothetical protein GCM10007147_14480 [Nocardiopsis kunsanensis]|uniref:histidine kinase n=2 Tax=Nocardiopsis kunsanensis TaxID=141693 RepID=A0A918XA89_9ACTN|nr:hypothetical protein GCM10007147_14480 [Nocardiopsis kunsanensis]